MIDIGFKDKWFCRAILQFTKEWKNLSPRLCCNCKLPLASLRLNLDSSPVGFHNIKSISYLAGGIFKWYMILRCTPRSLRLSSRTGDPELFGISALQTYDPNVHKRKAVKHVYSGLLCNVIGNRKYNLLCAVNLQVGSACSTWYESKRNSWACMNKHDCWFCAPAGAYAQSSCAAGTHM